MLYTCQDSRPCSGRQGVLFLSRAYERTAEARVENRPGSQCVGEMSEFVVVGERVLCTVDGGPFCGDVSDVKYPEEGSNASLSRLALQRESFLS